MRGKKTSVYTSCMNPQQQHDKLHRYCFKKAVDDDVYLNYNLLFAH